MIKATELRIGNWVQNKSECIQVKDFDTIGINRSKVVNGYLDTLDRLSGIPLSPKLLKKCGWKVVDQGGGAYLWNESHCWFHIFQSKEDGSFHVTLNMNVIKLGYLHQLQNCIHALTGSEIEIKTI